MTTWAVDLADVGAVYPWIGYEVIMVLVAVALWILWHIVQIRQENEDYARQLTPWERATTLDC